MTTFRKNFRVSAVAFLLVATWPAHAAGDPASTGPEDLRQIRADLHEIHGQAGNRKWAQLGELLLRIKKAFSRTTPQMLTRVPAEEMSQFSYALSTLEDGVISRDPAQLEQGFQLSLRMAQLLQGHYPVELVREFGDLDRGLTAIGVELARSNWNTTQGLLEDVQSTRRRLEEPGSAVARDSWTHLGLMLDNLSKAVRARNAGEARDALAGASLDARAIRDRLAAR